ncbi:MAG TPA: energy transducer TonB [Candidatus Sulfotelmatobacter sp.]|nr:energy transducer TonB [Candidatus Sulfotelmatobacter sp.]
MIANSQASKNKPQGEILEFTAGGRSYFRVNVAHGSPGRHQCMICTEAKDHLLVWNAGAPNEKGLDAIVATLNSIKSLPQRVSADAVESAGPKDAAAEGIPSKLVLTGPERVKVSAGVTKGLLIKTVPPIYPEEARRAYIQGTVLLQADIDKTGDITDLELLDGPIELAGSAVAAVRQWKYKPYLLLGQPVTVRTQIQVNYQLRR